MLDYDAMSAYERSVALEMSQMDYLSFVRIFSQFATQTQFSVNWHHVLFADAVEEVLAGVVRLLLINTPPGSGKTDLFSVFLPPYAAAKYKKTRHLGISFGKNLTSYTSRKIKTIMKHQAYQDMKSLKFSPDKIDEWQSRTKKDLHEYYCAPLTGQVTGKRSGFLDVDHYSGATIMDDLIAPKDAFSKPRRERVNFEYPNTVKNRTMSDKVAEIMVGQRVHYDDITNYFIENEEVDRHIIIPAIITQEYFDTLEPKYQELCARDTGFKGDPVSYWPKKEGIEFLKQYQKKNPYIFRSQYMQDPEKIEGGFIDIAGFGFYEKLPAMTRIEIFADTASKTKQRNDFSVFLVAGKGFDGKVYLIDMKRGKWESDDLLAECKKIWRKFKDVEKIVKVSKMRIEDKSSGIGLAQQMRRRVGTHNIESIQREQDKLSRVAAVIPEINDGNVMLPSEESEYTDLEWLTDFMLEVKDFKEDMTHKFDDQVDTLCDAIETFIVLADTGKSLYDGLI